MAASTRYCLLPTRGHVHDDHLARHMWSCNCQCGQVGGIEALLLGMVVLVVATLSIVDMWGVIDAKLATNNAATQGARAFVLATTSNTAYSSAQRAAAAAIAASGRNPGPLSLKVTGGLYRCSTITVSAAYPVHLFPLFLLGGRGAVVVVRSTQREWVSPFRGGALGQVPTNGCE